MIILQTRAAPRSSDPTTATTVGIVVGVVGALAFLLIGAQILSRGSSQSEEQQAANRTTSNISRTVRQRRRETDPEPLPPYESQANNRRISRNDVSYDAPAAFGLVEQITSTQRSKVAPSMQVTDTGPLPRNLTQRMAQVQRTINELNRLTSATPAGGYPPHSLEALKIVQLKQTIAVMNDEEGDNSRPAGQMTKRTSYEALELVTSGRSASPALKPHTLYARMQEVQRLLAEVDAALSQPASFETTVQVQTLRARIAEVMESESKAAGPSSIGAPSFPEPIHAGTGGKFSSTQTEETNSVRPTPAPPTICEPGRSEPGECMNAVDGDISPRPRGLPPAYEKVEGKSSNDYDGNEQEN